MQASGCGCNQPSPGLLGHPADTHTFCGQPCTRPSPEAPCQPRAQAGGAGANLRQPTSLPVGGQVGWEAGSGLTVTRPLIWKPPSTALLA